MSTTRICSSYMVMFAALASCAMHIFTSCLYRGKKGMYTFIRLFFPSVQNFRVSLVMSLPPVLLKKIDSMKFWPSISHR
jgi:hypothetical protein